jgi:hypothetical protein
MASDGKCIGAAICPSGSSIVNGICRTPDIVVPKICTPGTIEISGKCVDITKITTVL